MYGNKEEEGGGREFFQADYMEKDATSDQFLNHLTQDVPLHLLKKVIKSCYFDENMRFCAIMSEVVDHSLREHLGGQYLFEVWADGQLLY